MATVPKMSTAVVRVLETFLESPRSARYGLELGAHTGLPSGTIHPVLARLEAAGWVESEWEVVDPSGGGRPPRRFYRLTPAGTEQARTALSGVAARQARLRRRLAGPVASPPLPDQA